MMSLLLTLTLQLFKIQKRGKKTIKVGNKISNLSPDSLKNIDFSGSYKQSKIAYENA